MAFMAFYASSAVLVSAKAAVGVEHLPILSALLWPQSDCWCGALQYSLSFVVATVRLLVWSTSIFSQLCCGHSQTVGVEHFNILSALLWPQSDCWCGALQYSLSFVVATVRLLVWSTSIFSQLCCGHSQTVGVEHFNILSALLWPQSDCWCGALQYSLSFVVATVRLLVWSTSIFSQLCCGHSQTVGVEHFNILSALLWPQSDCWCGALQYSLSFGVCLFVGCLTSQQQASVSQGRI